MEIFIYKNFNLLNIYCSFYNTNSISLDLYYNYIQVPLGIEPRLADSKSAVITIRP